MAVQRRLMIKAMASAFGVTAVGAGARQTALAKGRSPAADPSRADIVRLAQHLSRQYADELESRDYAAIVDYGAPSWMARFHIVDLERSVVSGSFPVAHGKGSDPLHDGWLDRFSNVPGSLASSRGAYRTGVHYTGRYGGSMRLAGLDVDNSNAEARAIVLHPAWYAEPVLLKTQGKLGRSEGCFALSQENAKQVLECLGPGRLIFADKLSADTLHAHALKAYPG